MTTTLKPYNTMEWTSIIIAVFGIVGGVDLLRLLFVKEERRQKEAEAGSTELDTARNANDLLAEQLQRSHETIGTQTGTIAELREENARLRSTITALFDDMCVHKGCRIRKPHQGQGQKWYEEYRDDPSLGCDYLSIDTLMKQDRERRNAENLKTEEGQ